MRLNIFVHWSFFTELERIKKNCKIFWYESMDKLNYQLQELKKGDKKLYPVCWKHQTYKYKPSQTKIKYILLGKKNQEITSLVSRHKLKKSKKIKCIIQFFVSKRSLSMSWCVQIFHVTENVGIAWLGCLITRWREG